MKKYELTSETEVIHGVELHRIKAIESFGSVEKGELGGWIESEKTYPNTGTHGSAGTPRSAITQISSFSKIGGRRVDTLRGRAPTINGK